MKPLPPACADAGPGRPPSCVLAGAAVSCPAAVSPAVSEKALDLGLSHPVEIVGHRDLPGHEPEPANSTPANTPAALSYPMPTWPPSTSNVPSSTASGTTPSHQTII